jgi:hypothetical protein
VYEVLIAANMKSAYLRMQVLDIAVIQSTISILLLTLAIYRYRFTKRPGARNRSFPLSDHRYVHFNPVISF